MFKMPLTAEEEYWVDYLRADGCIVRKPRGKVVVFAQRYRKPVDEFAKFVEAPQNVRSIDRVSNFGRNILFSVSTARGARELDDLGCKTELEPTLYASAHFWRGLLDGDGSVAMIKNSGYLYPALSWSGSLVDMQALCRWMEATLGCTPPKVGKCRSIYTVRLNSSKARYLGLLLYRGQYSCLGYKRDVALSFEAWSPRVRRVGAWEPPEMSSPS